MNAPQLRDYKNFFSFDFTRRDLLVDGFSDISFVLIEIRRINVAVTVLKGNFGWSVAIKVGALEKRLRFLFDNKNSTIRIFFSLPNMCPDRKLAFRSHYSILRLVQKTF